MKTLSAALALVCLSFAASALVAAEPAPGTHGLQMVDSAWAKAMMANDAAACAALYADDAVLVLPGSPALKGNKAIADAYAGWLAEYRVTHAAIMDASYASSGEISSGWGAWALTMEPRKGGAAVTQRGTWCAVAKKQRDGTWKYAADHASEDPAPSPAK